MPTKNQREAEFAKCSIYINAIEFMAEDVLNGLKKNQIMELCDDIKLMQLALSKLHKTIYVLAETEPKE